MKIIFHCYSGSYYSTVAAGVYLGLVPSDRVSRPHEMAALPYFDAIRPRDYGKLNFVGRDKQGNEVYVLARRSLDEVTIKVLRGIAEIYGLPAAEMIFIDTTGPLSNLLSFGAFLSVRLGLPKLGRPLVIREMRRQYAHFFALNKDANRRIRIKSEELAP